MPPRGATVGAVVTRTRTDVQHAADMAVAMRFELTDIGKALGDWVEGLAAPVSFHTWSAVLVDMDTKGLGMTTKTDRHAL